MFDQITNKCERKHEKQRNELHLQKSDGLRLRTEPLTSVKEAEPDVCSGINTGKVAERARRRERERENYREHLKI